MKQATQIEPAFDTERPNGRVFGYSLRRSLLEQGVKTEAGIRRHSAFVFGTLMGNPNADITRYRVNKNNPESLPMMG